MSDHPEYAYGISSAYPYQGARVEKYCGHLKRVALDQRLRLAHVAVTIKSNPEQSRAELYENVFLCPICSGFFIAYMIDLEQSSAT